MAAKTWHPANQLFIVFEGIDLFDSFSADMVSKADIHFRH